MGRKDLFEHIKTCEFMNKHCDVLVLTDHGEETKCMQSYRIDDAFLHVHCNYAQDGCSFIGSQKSLGFHYETCMFKTMAPFISKMKNKVSVINAGLVAKDEQITRLT